ncbi:MAG TPA: 2-hydroxyacyl-CoA dehydratase family protein [Phycisphaerae bacterium]|nr:2-hydroxyacyl-CoA dehydratase family protein [Phycisphaerae bacterium]
MNTPIKALDEMIRLTSPFPESVAVKEWKAKGRKVIGWVNPYVPEEILYAAGMLPFQITGNNEPVQMQGAEAHIYSNTCSYIRTCWQLQLDGKYNFLDGLVSSSFCDQDKRLFSVWEYYKKLPYMDLLYAPRKRDEEAVALYLADLEDFRDRLSQHRLNSIPDRDVANSIKVYNRGRALMHQLYELRKRERPPVTGAEALEVSKAAARLPREQFNALMEQLLDEVQRTGREIKKGKRLMVIGNDLHNTNQIAELETLDAVVVVDEMNCGIRYAWGQVDTTLPPMEALARYYVLGRPVDMHNWNSDGRLEFIGELATQYKVDGIVSEIVRFCTYNGWDKFDLRKQMEKRGIPILDIDIEYGHPAGAQAKIRAEAFIEILEGVA